MTKKLLAISIATGVAVLATAFIASAQTTATATAGTTSGTTKIACVGAAVNARETALDGALTAYLAVRHFRLHEPCNGAFGGVWQYVILCGEGGCKSGMVRIRNIVQGRIFHLGGRENTAWSQFSTAAKACKAPAGTTDTADVVSSL